MLLTAEFSSPYMKTYVYIQNFLLEGNRPKITMESDSQYRKTYVYMQNFIMVHYRPK